MKGSATLCGIGGYIGESRHPEVTYQLTTTLFAELETRGSDAAGFWGTQKGNNGKILYHKEPEKASDFVKTLIWQNVCTLNPNLLLLHARFASPGFGTPSINRNNHPFVSSDKTVGLVHNGRIPDQEYEALRQKYEVRSKCDSEILLRIFEAGEMLDTEEDYGNADKQITNRLRGLRNIWSQVVRGQMTVGIGERLEGGQRRLWVFRNKFRTLWLIDMRRTLGQIFFCSAPEIWYDAVRKCPEAKSFVKRKTKLIELPEDEIWVFNISPQEPVVRDSCIRKFDVFCGGFKTFEHDGKPLEISSTVPSVEVFGKLDDQENVIDGKKPVINCRDEHGKFVANGHGGTPGLYNGQGAYSGGQGTYHYKKWSGTGGNSDAAYQKSFKWDSPRVDKSQTSDEPTSDEPPEDDPAVQRSLAMFNETPPKPKEEPKEEEPKDFAPAEEKPDPDITEMGIETIQDQCKEIRSLLNQLEAAIHNKKSEGSLDGDNIEDLIDSVESVKLELDGSLKLFGP